MKIFLKLLDISKQAKSNKAQHNGDGFSFNIHDKVQLHEVICISHWNYTPKNKEFACLMKFADTKMLIQ